MSSIKPQQMDDDKLNAFLDNELRQCIGFGLAGDNVSAERRKNLEYYLNEPLGDEEEGKSKLQSSDVQDVIEALLPNTLAPFISADKVVEFRAVGKEDEDYADMASRYINHIFMVDNDGINIQYTWQKDGLLQKNGFLYADWCEKERTARKMQRMDFAGLSALQQDKEIQIEKYAAFDPSGMEIPVEAIEGLMASADPMAIEGLVFEVDYRRSWKEGRVKVENIPPEYVVVSKTAKDTGTARLIGWQEEVTISDLREEGFDDEELEAINLSESERPDDNGERTAREKAQGGENENDNSSTDPASRRIWRTVCWAKVDFDGDGKTELRKIIRAGSNRSGGAILLNEEADEIPIVTFSPIPMPHQLFGRAVADLTRSIQDGKTSMLRMGMDATYHTVHPRWKLVEDSASDDTYNDLMLDIPGAPVRMLRGDAVEALRDAPDIGAAYQMLEYLDRMRETRTPVTRQDQGVDVDALNDKTAREATIQANASSVKKELILRLYAEALGKLFRLINRLVIKHQDKPRLLRLFPDRPAVSVDPRFWNADMDVSVKVGLGTGTRDQQLQSLMMINNIQMQDLQMGLPTVDPDKLYNTRARIIEYSGLSTPEQYFNDPSMMEGQGTPQQPSPEEIAAQQQAEAAQIEQALNERYEQGRAEGADQLKKYQIDEDNKTKVALKDKELQAKAQDSDKMMQAASKPAATIQINGEQAIAAVADRLGNAASVLEGIAMQSAQRDSQNTDAMTAALNAMTQAVQIMAAPKRGTLPGGKTVMIEPMLN